MTLLIHESRRLSRQWGSLALLILSLVAALATSGCNLTAAGCDVCGREKCTNMTMTIARDDGSVQHVCCARCGAHAIASGAPATSIMVKDFDNAEPIDATRALLVEGSDVHPCRGIMTNPPRDERGCCLRPSFDRCEPSVVAFGSPEAARRFIAAHGGTLTTWADIVSPAVPGS